MNDIMIGILAWIGIIAFMGWLYLFVRMAYPRRKNVSTTTLDDTESIEYKHSVMASDE